ncbi:MAG: UvrD-helicase domain-containing protein [Candidatus Omnitrophota bacterium]
MSKIIPPDNANRIKISKDLGKSFFVEAGAGSGKTHSLVERMTALVISGTAGIENIAAITFTRKASAELRERFQIKLENILRSSSSSKEKERAKNALFCLDRAFLGTIHSFCGKLLRERSVEAGVDPAFEAIEEEDNAVYAEEAWNRYIEREALRGTGEVEWMLSHGVDPYTLKEVFLKRTEHADVPCFTQDVPSPDLSAAKKEVKGFIRKISGVLPENEPSEGWDGVQSIVDRTRRLIGMGYLDDNTRFMHLLGIFSKDPVITIKRWGGLPSEEVKKIKEDYLALRESVILPSFQRWGEYLHKPVMEFIEKGVGEYRKWREERSLLNFQDLLTFTAAMLRDRSEVRNYFRSAITHLLVDEFQDTDPIQAEIIMLLTGEDGSENNWKELTPSPGSLFVVGDPKQSIYRFRRADIDTYNIVKKMFEEGGGEILSLDANFRSLPPIGHLANSIFSGIFPENGTKYQAAFAPLLTIRNNEEKKRRGGRGSEGQKGIRHPETPATRGIFINPVGKVEKHALRLVAERDADVIARWIKWAVSGGIKLERSENERIMGLTGRPIPSDFMILTRAKARLHIYARALEKMGIPYEISGGESFGDSEELGEICRLFRCLAEPSDPLNLVTVLRGPLFGVSDRDLYLFKRSSGEFSFQGFSGNSGGAIGQAFKKLLELRQFVIDLSPCAAAEKIVESCGIFPLAVSREMGSTRAGNIVKALELVKSGSFSGAHSFLELTSALEAFLVSKGKEEMSLFPAGSGAVRVMNLHKAKGLEASVVFLADPLTSGKEFEPDTHIVRTGDVSAGYFAATRLKNKFSKELETFAFPPGWETVTEEEKKYMKAERERLEYVALTRARNILCVSVYTDKSGTKKPAWGCIEPALKGMEAIKAMETEKIVREKVNLTLNEWEKEMSRVKTTTERLKRKSFETTSITRKAKQDASFDRSVSGGGRAWGNLVHKALEACGKGMRGKLPELAENWMIEEDMDPFRKDELLFLVDGIMKSDMWGRAAKAEERYFELPFSITRNRTVFSGAIDLVFKEDGAWVIVDYKTDDFERDPGRKAAYNRQLDMYAEFWEELTGEKVKEKLLFKAQ